MEHILIYALSLSGLLSYGGIMSENEIIIYDTEYWTEDGSPKRNWNGPDDQPPLLVQIGGLKVKVEKGLTLTEEFSAIVKPRNEFGQPVSLTPFFEKLTGITQQRVDEEGRELDEVLKEFHAFTGDRLMYSYGRDLLSTIIPSCFVQSVSNPFKPTQGKDIRKILRHSGMTVEELIANTSGSLAKHFGIELENHWVHDARCDAYSILITLRYLEEKKRLDISLLKTGPTI